MAMLSTPMIQVSGVSGESGERDVRVVLRRDMDRKGERVAAALACVCGW